MGYGGGWDGREKRGYKTNNCKKSITSRGRIRRRQTTNVSPRRLPRRLIGTRGAKKGTRGYRAEAADIGVGVGRDRSSGYSK